MASWIYSDRFSTPPRHNLILPNSISPPFRHYDFQENFTFQLSGSKRWRLRQSDVKSPQRGVTPHYLAPGPVENQLKTVSH